MTRRVEMIRGVPDGPVKDMTNDSSPDAPSAGEEPEDLVALEDRRQRADARDAAAEQRDIRADAREKVADQREEEADQRQTRADEREKLADDREARADAREASLDDLARKSGVATTDRFGRSDAAMDRSTERLTRSQDRIQRGREALRRDRREADREQDEIDRESAAEAARFIEANDDSRTVLASDPSEGSSGDLPRD